jgi:hypothetical protein
MNPLLLVEVVLVVVDVALISNPKKARIAVNIGVTPLWLVTV